MSTVWVTVYLFGGIVAMLNADEQLGHGNHVWAAVHIVVALWLLGAFTIAVKS